MGSKNIVYKAVVDPCLKKL